MRGGACNVLLVCGSMSPLTFTALDGWGHGLNQISHDVLAMFSGLDADRVLQRRNKDRAGAVVPRLGGPGDAGDRLVHQAIRDHDVDSDPRGEIDRVFLPAVGLGVTPEAIGLLYFAHSK